MYFLESNVLAQLDINELLMQIRVEILCRWLMKRQNVTLQSNFFFLLTWEWVFMSFTAESSCDFSCADSESGDEHEYSAVFEILFQTFMPQF